MGINEYFLYQSESREGPFEELVILPATEAPKGTYLYHYPPPTASLWFKAQALTASGGFTLTSLAVPATVSTGPSVVVGDTVNSLATSRPEISVTVNFGDTLLVGLDAAYTNALRIPVAGPGLPTVFNLDLGIAAPDDTFELYIKAFDDLSESAETVVTLPVDFDPRHTLVDANPGRLATRVNDLQIPIVGVTRMRFAPSEAELAFEKWSLPAEIFPDYELTDTANPQEIWGEFGGDFGFDTTSKLSVRPDLLGSASFQLKLPANRIVSVSTVTAEFSAQATELRISESPDFSAVSWQPFVTLADFQLSTGEGTKTVYAQYRNDWTESVILNDYCIFVSQGLDVKILAPLDGHVIVGGSVLTTRGTSNAGTVAAAIDSVRLDLGDGRGFEEVIGTESWQINWVVPTLTEDTEWVLRARAWADTFAVTDVATVTITQLVVNILSPLDGATIAGGEPVTIGGTASGLLGGAPMDSVVVDIGTEHLLAGGTAIWNTSWKAPVVGSDTPTDITATVWAGGESASRTIVVTVTP